jgi:3-isopropylmalate/(R)-2-methylmalate dehydratase small subunit
VISTSFADIFYNNCFKNGILPVVVAEDELQLLMKDAEKGSNARMVVDLENQQIETSDGEVISFDVDQHRKHCLINGLDDIGLSMEKIASIDAFETQMAQRAPWV